MPYKRQFYFFRRPLTLKLLWTSVLEIYYWWFNQSYFFKTTVITFCSLTWITIWVIVYPPKQFAICTIQLTGETNPYATNAVENFLLPYIGKGILEINARALQTDLLKRFTWMEAVIIRRTISGILVIQVIPRRPTAQFESIGQISEKRMLIDYTGFVFESADNMKHFDHLPYFKGSISKVKYMLHFYEELNTILQAQNLKIMQLQLDQEMRFNIQLNNGMRLLLGHIDPLHQLKRLLSLNVQVLHRADQIASIDLRYSKGMAVKLHESIK